MDKTYKSQEHEQKIYSFWERGKYFRADPDSNKNPYGLLMPPPNLTGELHPGQVMQHAILDSIARFKRMQQLDVLLLPGVDHAGIQFEGTLNRLLEQEGLTKEKLGREKWLERAWQFKDEVYASFHKTWKLLGVSADWAREVFTLEPKVQKAVFEEFKLFWEHGLLYKGPYIVQWCPKCGTAIEDIEIEYEERKEKLYFVKYRIVGTKNEYITIATTRPETIFADDAIAVYPNHPQYSQYVGMTAEKPLAPSKKLVDIEIKVIEDKRVEKEFGTGALKITPGHDPLDFEIGRDHGLLTLHAIDKNGRMTEITGDLVGLPVLEAREKAVKKLEDMGTLERIEDHTHSVPVCERCKTTIEPLISEEWFVRVNPLAQKALKNIKRINFLPKNYLKIISGWLGGIHDWSISRSLWWGHRIPVWYCQKCNPRQIVVNDRKKNWGIAISLEEPKYPCQNCGIKQWVQDEQVLDTWFSSSLWPLSTLGWPDETKELKRYYPWDFELTAPEIRYLWIARMIMLGLWLKSEIPFKNMFFHGTLRELQGRKISKSLGNYFSPLELIDQWGTDATRMALLTYGVAGRDGRTSKQVIDERAKNFRNFGNKLWNVARYITSKPLVSYKRSNHKDDKWVMEELKKTTEGITKNLETFKLHLAAELIYNFIWHKFADIYIEKTKTRRDEAQPTLLYVLDQSLRLLHPFMPFITETIWQEALKQNPSERDIIFNTRAITIAKWPETKK